MQLLSFINLGKHCDNLSRVTQHIFPPTLEVQLQVQAVIDQSPNLARHRYLATQRKKLCIPHEIVIENEKRI